MSDKERRGPSSPVKVLLIANLCIWIYFVVGFVHASYPYEPIHWGHPSGTGFTFWGHSIALGEPGAVHPFFRLMFFAELPSFALAWFAARVFDPHLVSPAFFLGVSEGGWILIVTMLLSFFQWYLIGSLIQKLWSRWSKPLTSSPSRASAERS
jgi:hypothetical protein